MSAVNEDAQDALCTVFGVGSGVSSFLIVLNFLQRPSLAIHEAGDDLGQEHEPTLIQGSDRWSGLTYESMRAWYMCRGGVPRSCTSTQKPQSAAMRIMASLRGWRL